jgi:GAF domain-containing protein
MSARTRESRLNSAFLTLSDTLTDDYDVVELLQTLVDECVGIFDVEAAGIMLADASGRLQLVASSSQKADLVEIMQLDAGLGPCVQSYETGKTVSVGNIEEDGTPWPEFTAVALAQGFHAIYAIPMKLRGDVIGTLNLLSTSVGALGARDAEAARALTDVATIGVLQERVSRGRSQIADQLQHALDSRIVIEQAKGIISQVGSLDMDQAFDAMRKFARSRSIGLHLVATMIINRSLDVAAVIAMLAVRPR